MSKSGLQLIVIGYVSAFFLLTTLLYGVNSSQEEMRLVQGLLGNYSRFLKPAPVSGSGPTVVKLALRVEQIFELEEKSQVFAASVYVVQSWTDSRLTWDPSKYGGIKEVSFSGNEIWVPDLILMNNAEMTYTGRKLGMESPIHISNDGNVIWYSNVLLKSFCKMKVRSFPFDEQFCPVHIASWTYIGTELLLVEGNDIAHILQNYTENTAWKMVDAYYVNSSRVDRNFPNIPKATITYFFHLQRNVFYYFVYLFAPCMLTSLLMTLIFLAPPDCGERMVIGVTNLLALTVFFMLAAKNIPETSEDVPLMGRYYSASIIIMSIAMVSTAIVLRFHHSSSDIPHWIKMYILGYMAYFVRVKTPQNTEAKSEREFTKEGESKIGEEFLQGMNSRCGISMMATRVLSEAKRSAKQDEWRLAARILNRFFLWLYMFAIAVSIIGIFIQIPGLIISRPAKPMTI